MDLYIRLTDSDSYSLCAMAGAGFSNGKMQKVPMMESVLLSQVGRCISISAFSFLERLASDFAVLLNETGGSTGRTC